jgi:hypothetical protein
MDYRAEPRSLEIVQERARVPAVRVRQVVL